MGDPGTRGAEPERRAGRRRAERTATRSSAPARRTRRETRERNAERGEPDPNGSRNARDSVSEESLCWDNCKAAKQHNYFEYYY